MHLRLVAMIGDNLLSTLIVSRCIVESRFWDRWPSKRCILYIAFIVLLVTIYRDTIQ